jgi:hypothetical protein
MGTLDRADLHRQIVTMTPELLEVVERSPDVMGGRTSGTHSGKPTARAEHRSSSGSCATRRCSTVHPSRVAVTMVYAASGRPFMGRPTLATFIKSDGDRPDAATGGSLLLAFAEPLE